MSVLRVEAQLSSDELLNAVAQLSVPELDQFVVQVLDLQSQRKAPKPAHTESELLLKINGGLPAEVYARLDQLIAGRDARTLTPEEQAELVSLTDRIEVMDARRAEHLIELARLRSTTLPLLVKALGIRPRPHG
ncbi:MAG: STAS/SEC14 domain-containing protein [Chloroflexia bacterium]